MSFCTGAYVLAKTGLLSGKSATTFHMAYEDFAVEFPDIHLKRGARFVEDGNLASSGGLTSGMDLAFRVVERYFGRDLAEETAYNIEYQDAAGRTRTRTWSTPNHAVSAPTIVSARCAAWTATPRLPPSTKARLICSV